MPRPRTTTAPARRYRLVLQDEDTSEVVAQYGNLSEDKIRPILQGLSALVHVAGFQRDLQGLLGRLGL